jgi:hypothetical protein
MLFVRKEVIKNRVRVDVGQFISRKGGKKKYEKVANNSFNYLSFNSLRGFE